MERAFNARQIPRNMYPSLFNRFPLIQPVSSKVRSFSTFLHILAFPGYAPGTIAVNVTWIERGFNATQTHRSIYPSIFNRLRAIARYWSEIETLFYPLMQLTPPLGCSHWNSGKTFSSYKTRILTIGWAVLTQYQRVTDGRTDGQTDVQPIAITCVGLLTHVNKKDGYRQRNVRQFLQSALRHIIWLPYDSHAGMSICLLPLPLLEFGYVKRV